MPKLDGVRIYLEDYILLFLFDLCMCLCMYELMFE